LEHQVGAAHESYLCLTPKNANLERRLNELEKKYDAQLKAIFDAIRQLMTQPEPDRKKIGFHLKERHSPYMVRVKKRHPN
jgi:DnaJ-domain-containing protein 1